MIVLSQTLRKPNRTVEKKLCPARGYRVLYLPSPQLYPYFPIRLSSGAGMLDIQELKEATELRSRLQTVSEPGEWSFIGTRAWESGPAGCTA